MTEQSELLQGDFEHHLSEFIYKHRGSRYPFGIRISTVDGDVWEPTFYKTDTPNVHMGQISWISFRDTKAFTTIIPIDKIAAVRTWYHFQTPQYVHDTDE